MNPWYQIANDLRRSCPGDHEDDVQETLLRLLRRLGPEPSPQAALELGGVVMFGLRVDRSRRQAQRLLGEGTARVTADELDDKERERRDVRRFDASVATALGRKGVELLDELLDGPTSNKALARRLRTSPAAVRHRRVRILRVLGQWLSDGEKSLGE